MFWNDVLKRRLNPAIKRHIKRKEKELGRTCRMIWIHTNKNKETYMYANFCKNWNRLIVTLAYYRPGVGFVHNH